MTDQNEVLAAALRTLELNLNSLRTLSEAVSAVAELAPVIEHQIEVTEATVTVIEEALTPMPELEAPTGLTATTNLNNRIEVSWDSVETADSYLVYADGVAELPLVETQASFEDLAPEQEMEFVVVAVRDGVAGPQSEVVMGATLPEVVVPPTPEPGPVLPGNFTAQVLGETVLLRWDTPLPEETPGVQVHRRPDFREGDSGWQSLTKEAQDGWDDVNLPKLPASEVGAGWEYRIRGFNDNNAGGAAAPKASSWSSVLSVVFPPDPGPGPGPDPGPGSDFSAIEGLTKTRSENKAVIDPIRAGRAPRPSSSAPGNIDSKRWDALKDADGNVEFKDMYHLPVNSGAGWNSNLFLDPNPPEVRSGSLTYRNLGWDNIDSPGMYFGTREYNCPERFVFDCDFTNQSTYHSLYLAPYDDVTITGSTWKNIAGQAVQLAQRPVASGNAPQNNVPLFKKNKLTVKDSHFIDCARRANAASWNFTVYGFGNEEFPADATFENCSFVCKWDIPRKLYGYGSDIWSTGGICFQPRGGGGVGPVTSHTMNDVKIKNCLFDYTSMDRSVVEFRGIKNAVMEDCAIILRDCAVAKLAANKYVDADEARLESMIFRNVQVRAENTLADRKTKVSMTYFWSNQNGDYTVIADISCPGSEKEYDKQGQLVYEGPIRTPGGGEFRALDASGNSSEQNKALRLPDVRTARSVRTPVGTIGDVGRDDWNPGDGDLWKGNMESVVPQGYAQWSSNLHRKIDPRPGKYTWSNIGISPGEGADQLKWGTREYNAPFRQFLECDFSDIPREHGLYVSNYEGTEVIDCTFLRCGSQGIQFAHRPQPYSQYDADNLPYSAKPLHILRNSHFVDNAYKGDRPSYNATYFNPGTSAMPGTLRIEDCTFVSNWDEPKFYNNKELRSTGALVTADMGGNAPLIGGPMMEKVTIKNTLFDYTRSDRPIISLRSVQNILIEDCCIILRDCTQPAMNVDKYIDSVETKSKTITVRNTYVSGGLGQIMLIDGSAVQYDMHCPGEEIVIDGATGQIVSRRTL